MIVSDSTPLIHLAKLGALELLQELFEEIYITEAVYREVVTEGKSINAPDAKIVKRFVNEWIHVKSIGLETSKEMAEKYGIDVAEAGVIALGKDLKTTVLINERRGRIAAGRENLEVIGTIGILKRALDKGIINKKKYQDLLSTMRNSREFWIHPSVIEEALGRLG